MSDEDMDDRVVSIHLLHGTWARGFFPKASKPGHPRWFEFNSPFSRALAARLRDRGIRACFPHPFLWSGSNSLAGRCRAVPGFRHHIERDNDSPRVVIAHSHGGNIALRAIATMAPENRPSGIVTLSTPFIVTRAKEPSASEILMAVVVFFALVFGPLYAFGAPFMSGRYAAPPPATPEQAARFIFALLYTLCSVGIFLFGSLKRKGIVERAIEISPRVSEEVPMFALRSPGDEASLVLAWGDLVERLNALLRKILDVLTEAMTARVVFLAKRLEPYHAPIATIGTFAFVISCAALAWLHSVGDKDPGHVYLAFSPILVMLSPALVIAGIAALALIAGTGSLIVTCFASLGYGLEYAAIGWEARTTCETTPLDATVPVRSIDSDDESFLSHGIYESREAVERVADWIAGLVGTNNLGKPQGQSALSMNSG